MIKPFSSFEKQKGQHRGSKTGQKETGRPEGLPHAAQSMDAWNKKSVYMNVDAYLRPFVSGFETGIPDFAGNN